MNMKWALKRTVSGSMLKKSQRSGMRRFTPAMVAARSSVRLLQAGSWAHNSFISANMPSKSAGSQMKWPGVLTPISTSRCRLCGYI